MSALQMQNKPGKFYVDWINIKKSTIYGAVGLILLLAAIGAGGWYLSRADFLSNQPNAPEIPKDAAQILSFEGDVRIVRAATRETILVTRATFAAAGDTIQTGADGRAQVKMIDGSTLSIRPNSTIVIRDSSSIFGGADVRVSLDDGQINVKTEDQSENTQNVVEVLESENRLKAQTDASFGINPNNSGGEIRISRGSVETSAGGEQTVLQSDEFASLNNGKIASKEKLLNPPNLVAPAPSAQIGVGARGTADASFRWEDAAANVKAAKYHLQVSSSPFFVADAMIVERDALGGQGFSFGNLAPGTYYWRVRATAESGQTSEWSEPLRFTVVKNAVGERLSASNFQVESVGGNVYIISGTTQAGANVRSAGRETFAAADGSFRLQISSASGEATVEINDERGNRSGYVISLSNAYVLRRF